MNFKIWFDAVRLKFLPQGIFPVILGSAVAWYSVGVFNLHYFFLVFIAMTLVQFGLTMLNDIQDYQLGTDGSSTSEKNPYSGGSGVLVDGAINSKEMLIVVFIFYLCALLIGLYLTIKTGLPLFYLIIVGFFLSIFYSAPPLRLAYRGFGELAMLIGYGPIITLGAYYVQVNSFATQAFLAGLVPGILMWAMIIINEIPDYKEDKRAKKKNLVVRIGRKKGLNAFILSVGFIFLFITSMSLLGVFPLLSLISLLSGIFAINSVRYLRKYYLNKDKVFLANKEMVKLYSSTVLLFSLGFLI
tara:strand:- start:1298 stop:2197 length:900 start_codon:yes stop_codon:yes gene_type:complete